MMFLGEYKALRLRLLQDSHQVVGKWPSRLVWSEGIPGSNPGSLTEPGWRNGKRTCLRSSKLEVRILFPVPLATVHGNVERIGRASVTSLASHWGMVQRSTTTAS